jgi:hypothetical protein
LPKGDNAVFHPGRGSYNMSDFFRVQLGVISRSEGHSAAKRSAYQSCGRIVDHEGTVFDFSRKAAEHVRTIMLAPDGAPDWARDPATLWQRAAQAEKRVDAQEARIVDFSMPRAIPAHLWDDCIRHVYAPYVRMGMVLQIDIHDTLASDGGRNTNVHGLATLREIDGEGFTSRKNRSWNDAFRERSGRAVREAFAARLTEFCQHHGIDYEGDARSNAERDLPDPEPELPRWNFEAANRGDDVTEALAALQDHRRRRRLWDRAKSEQDAAEQDLGKLKAELRKWRSRRVTPAAASQQPRTDRDRRAAVLRAWHGGGWVDIATVSAIASTRYDEQRGCLWIDLKDGATLIDRGDFIALRGEITWQAALETAAAAERHGWTEIHVHGDKAYKDAVSIAAMLRGIPVANHTLSPEAQQRYEALVAEREAATVGRRVGESPEHTPTGYAASLRRQSSRDLHARLTKRAVVREQDSEALTEAEGVAPVLRPQRPALRRSTRPVTS